MDCSAIQLLPQPPLHSAHVKQLLIPQQHPLQVDTSLKTFLSFFGGTVPLGDKRRVFIILT